MRTYKTAKNKLEKHIRKYMKKIVSEAAVYDPKNEDENLSESSENEDNK